MVRTLLTLALLASVTTFATTRAEEATAIGQPPADFRLPNVVTGTDVRLSDSKDTIRVVIFYSHTCTFCRQYEGRFRRFAADHAGKGVTVLAVDSTGGDAEESAAAWKDKKMGFPLLRDVQARTAAALGATALTTVAVVDARGNLRYLGAFDDSESGKEIRGRFVADAVASLLSGRPVPQEQTDVYGCMIPLPK